MDNYFTGDFHADSYLMYGYLEELDLYTGTERGGKKFFTRKEGSKRPESTKFGWTWRKYLSPTKNRMYDPEVGLYKTKLMEQHPYLMDLFKEYGDYHFPDFDFKQVTINRMPKGTSTKQHLDKVNVGDSILVAYGDYGGGRTYIQNEKDSNFKIVDCRTCLTKFNGSQLKHGVTTITSGKRYSLVFYNNKVKKIKDYDI